MIFSKIEVFNSPLKQLQEAQMVNEFLGLGALCMCMFFMNMFGKKDDDKKDDNKNDDNKKPDSSNDAKSLTSTDTSTSAQGEEGGKGESNPLSLIALFNKQKEKGEAISDEDQKDFDMMCSSMYDKDGNTLTPEQQQEALKSNFKKEDGSFDEDAFKKFQDRQVKKYNDAKKDGSLEKVEDAVGKITPEEQKKAEDSAKEHAAVAHETNATIEDEIKKAKEQVEKDKEKYKNELSEDRISARTEERKLAIEKEAREIAKKANTDFDSATANYKKDWGEDGVGGEKTSRMNDLEIKLQGGNVSLSDRQKWEDELEDLKSEKKIADKELENQRSIRDKAREKSQEMARNAQAQADKDIADENKEIQSKIDNSDSELQKSIEKIKSPEHQKEIRSGVEAKKKSAKEPESNKGTEPKKEPESKKEPEAKKDLTDDEKKEEYKKMLKKAGKSDEDVTNIMKDLEGKTGDDLDNAIDTSAGKNNIEIDDSTDSTEEEGTEEEDDGKGGKSKTKFRKTRKKVGKGVKFERWSPTKNEWQPASKDDYSAWKKRQKQGGSPGANESLSSYIRRMLND